MSANPPDEVCEFLQRLIDDPKGEEAQWMAQRYMNTADLDVVATLLDRLTKVFHGNKADSSLVALAAFLQTTGPKGLSKSALSVLWHMMDYIVEDEEMKNTVLQRMEPDQKEKMH